MSEETISLTKLRKELKKNLNKIDGLIKSDTNPKIPEWKKGKVIAKYFKSVNFKDSYKKVSESTGYEEKSLRKWRKVYGKCRDWECFQEDVEQEEQEEKEKRKKQEAEERARRSRPPLFERFFRNKMKQ